MPKSKAVLTPDIYVVLNGPIFDSVHASINSANARSATIKAEGKDGKVEVHQIQGGTVNIDAGADAQAQATKTAAPKEPAPKAAPKAAPKKEKPTKVEPEAAPAAKKTQTLAEQRAANTGGSKADDEELPESMKALLAGSGVQLSGLTVVVTGVPPTLGRKNADKLVENYGGKLGKSLSKNTDYVVLGNKAGPKKLEQIEELGTKTMNELEFVAFLEAGGVKRGAEEDEDEAVVKPSKSKKVKA